MSLDLNSLDYSDTDLWAEIGGRSGSVYEYMGETASLDLAAQDYTDLGYWKPVSDTELFPQGFNITQSPSTAVGGLVVLNDVRSYARAYVENATVTAASVSIAATEQAIIRAAADSTASSSGGSSFTGQGTSLAATGVVTTNRVLSKADAHLKNSDVTTAGDVTLSASNVSEIDATTESASSSGANSVSFQLAFNTIGWLPTNLLFAALDALIGDPTIQGAAFGGPEPAETLRLLLRLRCRRRRGGLDLGGVRGEDHRPCRQHRDLCPGRPLRRRRHERQRRAREQHGEHRRPLVLRAWNAQRDQQRAAAADVR